VKWWVDVVLLGLGVGGGGNYLTRVIDWLAPRIWARRALALAGARYITWPSDAIKLRRVVALLVVALFVATLAKGMPPAILPRA
jgi:hypothetical protein